MANNAPSRRPLILLLAGLVFIALAWTFRPQLHEWLREGFSLLRHDASEAQRITQAENAAVARHRENPFGIPRTYGFNQADWDKYQGWIRDTLAESDRQPVILVDKLARTLALYRDGKAVEQFVMDLGGNPIGDKFLEGDKATPEGRYYIRQVKDVGQTRYYRAYLIDYPNRQDLAELRRLKQGGKVGVGQGAGGLIEVHGQGGWGVDWTLGCMAVSNAAMDKLFSYGLEPGTPVTIVRYGTRSEYGE